MKKIMKHSLLITSFVLSGSFAYAGTDIEFALKLAKDGYPELAQKYLEREPVKSNPNKEGRAKAFCEIYLQMARSSQDVKTRSDWLKKAVEASAGINRTVTEKAEFAFTLANEIRRALKEPGLTEDQRNAIAKEVVPYYEDAKNQYKAYVEANKTKFEEFIEKAISEQGQKFLNSAQGKKELKEIYQPFIISAMRYFECAVEKANITPKNDSSRCTGLDKIIEEAEALSYTIEAPVPSATINTYVARIHGLLADCGVNPKENLEKAMEKFKEVFGAEVSGADASIIRDIKAKAVNGLLEMSLRTADFESALEVIEKYTSSNAREGGVMPQSYKFTIDDFEVLLNGILINANCYKKPNEKEKDKERFQRNIDKLKLHLEKAANNSQGPIFWKKKISSYITEAAIIMGKDLSDPLILIQLADDKRGDQKFEEALGLYEKALAGKIGGSDRINKKPSAMFNMAFCAFKIEKFDIAVKVMKDFFTEFPPTDPKNKTALKDQYDRTSKLYYQAAAKQYNLTKADADKDAMMKALDIYKIFNPDGAIFIQINTLMSTGNFIDSIKLAESIKKESVDYDRAMYSKGIAQNNYAREVKQKNGDTHNELSLKLAKDAFTTFQDLIKFIKEDTQDIIQEKRDHRKIWERESKKLSAFMLVFMDDHKNAIAALKELNEDLKKKDDDKKSSNRLSVIQSLLGAYNRQYSAEKESAVKMEIISQFELTYNELKDLDLNAFTIKDSAKKPEDRKKETVANNGLVLGMWLFSNPLKDAKIAARGNEMIRTCVSELNKKIDNLDLFLARKSLELKDFDSASINLEKVKKEYIDKGWSSPLTAEDFNAVKTKIISDETRTFFRNNFENFAFPPQATDGKEIKKNTRDYARLMRNLEYITGEPGSVKIENDEEKKINDTIQAQLKKDKALVDLKPSILNLKKKLNDFLTYLGIIDDLATCYRYINSFEKAISYSEELRVNYPGIISEDKKLADLKYQFAEFLGKEKDTKAIAQFNEASAMYVEIRNKVQNNPKSQALYIDCNERRLMCAVWVYKITQDKKKLEEVITAMKLLYTNQENYINYTNLFAKLEDLAVMPAELKPLTPEEIRAKNEANEKEELEKIRKLQEEKLKEELSALEKRKKKMVGTDASYMYIEMRDLENSVFDLYKSYYEKIKGAPKLNANLTERDLVDAYNLIIRRIDMYKMIKDDLNMKDEKVIKQIKEIDDYVALQGIKGEGSLQMISMNRLILEACFPQLPKAFGEEEKK